MKLLLVLEHHFYKNEKGDYYSNRVINKKFIDRYLSEFASVTICARVSLKTQISGDFEKANSSRVDFCELPDFTGIKGLIKNYYKITKIFRAEIKHYKVVMFRAPSPISLMLYRFAKEKHVVAVEFVMGANRFFSQKYILGSVLNKIVDSEAKRMCKNANAVSYVTESYLQEKYPSYSIINGPDDLHIDSSYSSIEMCDEDFFLRTWNYSEKLSDFVIVHIGYMDSDRKGHKILLDAIAYVINTTQLKVKLELVGDGKLRHEYEIYAKKIGIADNVKFWGAISSKKDKREILKRAHLFVLPSKSEGLPRVLIEAMGMGVPCIGSNVDGIPELLQSHCIINGFNSEDYGNKIIELLNNWEEMIDLAKDNYERSKKYHQTVLTNKRRGFYRGINQICNLF